MVAKKQTRLGRPPSSSSFETRERILTVARESFAELGYGVTTNKYLATKAGITTGALYHYFDSKVEIYGAVYEHTQALIYSRFQQAFAETDTFMDGFERVLEAAYDLNIEDPSIARFVGAARIDASRHDELRGKLRAPAGQGRAFWDTLVDRGIATGEIEPGQRDVVRAFVQTILVGLTDAVSGDPKEHRMAIDAIAALLEGRMLGIKVMAANRKAGERRKAAAAEPFVVKSVAATPMLHAT